MNRLSTFFATLCALLAFAAPANATSVAATTNATARVVIAPPAQVRKLQDLNFALLSVTTAGTAVVNPNDDSMTTTGGVLYAGWTPYAAQFEAISPIKNVVHIKLPKTATVLTRVGGTETMTVDTFTINGALNRNVVSKQVIAFKVGGTLHVNAGQAEGLYVGTFAVDIQFP